MDSARFIRRQSVLALWVITPLAVITGILIISRSVLKREKIGLIQDRELAQLIPEMEDALKSFDGFYSGYRMDKEIKQSMENHHIMLFNLAADDVDFTITAINLEQDPPDKTPPGTVRISLSVKGTGSNAGIATFLNNIKLRDNRLYEKRIKITSGRSQTDRALLEAEFGRIYLDTENHNENSIQN